MQIAEFALARIVNQILKKTNAKYVLKVLGKGGAVRDFWQRNRAKD